MGFFKSIMNIAKGEPVFTAGQPQKPQPNQTGSKQIPQVYIERVESRATNNGFECDCTIQNYSQQTVVLESLELMEKDITLNDHHLKPGEQREFRVYSGPRPTSPDSRCTLHFRDTNGDYFSSEHYADFLKQPDGTFVINKIRFTHLDDE